jgi:hypothetical protein
MYLVVERLLSPPQRLEGDVTHLTYDHNRTSRTYYIISYLWIGCVPVQSSCSNMTWARRLEAWTWTCVEGGMNFAAWQNPKKINRQSDHWKGMRHSYGLLVTQTRYRLPRKRGPENGNSKKSPAGRWPTSSKCGFRGRGGTSDTVELLELLSGCYWWAKDVVFC